LPKIYEQGNYEIYKITLACGQLAPQLLRWPASQPRLHLRAMAARCNVKLRASSVSLDPHEWDARVAVFGGERKKKKKRDTMANVLLQREAQPADSLLPQRLSGYAFLFESSMNLQARQGSCGPLSPAGVPGRDSAFAIACGRSGRSFSS